MKLLAVLVLGIVMLFAAFVGVASSQQIEKVAILLPFSVVKDLEAPEIDDVRRAPASEGLEGSIPQALGPGESSEL